MKRECNDQGLLFLDISCFHLNLLAIPKSNLGKNQIQFHMDAKTLAVFQTNIEVPSDTTSIQIAYLETKIEESFKVPESTIINITNPKDTLEIELNYASVKINKPSEIKIKIPDSYFECNK